MLLLHLQNGELHTVYKLLVLGSHKLQELTKNLPITKTVWVPSNTKSNKLSRLHLTLTEMALSSSTLATLAKVGFFNFGTLSSSRSSSLSSKHSLLFSWVASGIQCVKGIINEPEGGLI